MDVAERFKLTSHLTVTRHRKYLANHLSRSADESPSHRGWNVFIFRRAQPQRRRSGNRDVFVRLTGRFSDGEIPLPNRLGSVAAVAERSVSANVT